MRFSGIMNIFQWATSNSNDNIKVSTVYGELYFVMMLSFRLIWDVYQTLICDCLYKFCSCN